MGTRVGMEHVQERLHIQLSTSQTHQNIPTCDVLRYRLVSVVVIGFQIDALAYEWIQVGIFWCVWLVDSWTWGHSWTCSIPTHVPILFSPVSHLPTFPEIKKKIYCTNHLANSHWTCFAISANIKLFATFYVVVDFCSHIEFLCLNGVLIFVLTPLQNTFH